MWIDECRTEPFSAEVIRQMGFDGDEAVVLRGLADRPPLTDAERELATELRRRIALCLRFKAHVQSERLNHALAVVAAVVLLGIVTTLALTGVLGDVVFGG